RACRTGRGPPPSRPARRSAPTNPRSLLERLSQPDLGRPAASLVRPSHAELRCPSLLFGNFSLYGGNHRQPSGNHLGPTRVDMTRMGALPPQLPIAHLARAGSWPARHGDACTVHECHERTGPWVRRLFAPGDPG